jgi:ABC-type glycerol-3-phosphate transport system substrate-binding protein
MTNKQFDAIVRTSAGMEEFDLTEHMKNKLRETIANPVTGKNIRRLTARTVLITVLIVMLLSAVAYAAATNPTIIEIYTSWFGEDSNAVKTLNEQTVQTPELSFELDDVTIRLTQVIFDGNTLYTTGTVAAKETSNVVIMADDYSPKDPANADFHRSKEDFSKAPTYQETAQQKGAKLLHTYVWVEAEGGDGSYMNDTIPLTDGTYSFINEFPDAKVTGDSIKGTIGALQYEVTEDGIEIPGTRVRKDWTFNVPAIAKEFRTPVPTPEVTPVPAGIQEQALVVIGDSSDSQTAGSYKAAYPDSPVIYQNLYDENGMQHTTEAVKQGTVEWDVISVSLSQIDLPLLMEGGYLADLAGYETLMGKVSSMHPAIRDALMRDGRLYAVPQRIYNRIYYCGSLNADEDIWTASGLTQSDIPKTIDELCDFIDKWLDRPADQRENGVISFSGVEGSYHAWLLDMLLDQYIDYHEYANEPLNFDTDLFARLLKRIDEVSARLLKEEKAGQGKWILFNDSPNPIGSATRVAPLRLENDLPYLASSDMFVYIINPSSKHMEQAIAYAECSFSVAEDSQRAMLYEGITQKDLPNTNREADLKDWEENITYWEGQVASAKTASDLEKAKEALKRMQIHKQELSDKIYAVEADDLEAYQKNIAPNLFFPVQKFYYESSENWIAMDTMKKNYLADKITDEEFIKALNELAQKAEAK